MFALVQDVFKPRRLPIKAALATSALVFAFGVGLIVVAAAMTPLALRPWLLEHGLVAAAFFAALAAPAAWLTSERLLDSLHAFADAFARAAQAEEGAPPLPRLSDPDLNRIAEAAETLRARASAPRAESLRDARTKLLNEQGLSQILAAAPQNGRAGLILLSLKGLARLAEVTPQASRDAAIAAVAARLEETLPAIDSALRGARASQGAPAILARLSELELAVLAPGLVDPGQAERYARLLLKAADQAGLIEAGTPPAPVAGIAFLAARPAALPSALRRARLAAQDASPVRLHDPSLDRRIIDRFALEQEMRSAISAGQIQPFFQPKVNLATGEVIGAEALARWRRIDGTAVSPAEFIPAAEEAGLIGPLFASLMEQAAYWGAQWAGAGGKASLAVNVSVAQLEDADLARSILDAVDAAGFPADRLQIEITESLAITDVDKALNLIAPLRSRGVSFAIDDFGAGHSSLAALSRIPFDALKIDQLFIRRLQLDAHAPAIVETILAMASALGVQTIAEGVETEDQAYFLKRRGCAQGQGYLYGPALPPSAFMELIGAKVANDTQARRAA